MRDSIESYKQITLKKKVLELAKTMVGRDHFFNLNQHNDEESGNSKDGQLQ